MNGMNLQDLYKQYGSKPISEYMNEQMQSNGYSQNMGQNQMTHHSAHLQRTAATGQTKHRAISVTDAPKPLMDAGPQQYLGFQKSMNSGVSHMTA